MQIGNVVGGGTYLCAAGTEWCSFLATGCWLMRVVAILVSRRGSDTSMIAGIWVFRLVCRWWMWGVVMRTLGYIGLPDNVMPVSTLLGVAVFTFCGGIFSNLGSRAFSTLCCGLSDRIDCNFWMISSYFLL